MATTVTARLPVAALAAEHIENATINYNPDVLEALRHVAQNAFDGDAQPILGLLLGRRTSTGPTVTAWLPANALTTGRDQNLTRAVEVARLEFPGESPLGWVRSKHQGEARLTTEELQSASFVIPGGNPLAVVLRPSSQRPMRLASYLAMPGVPLAGERPFQEFFVHPRQAAAAQARAVTLPLPPAPGAASPVRSSDGRFRDSREGLRWALPAGLLILIAVAGLMVSRLQIDDPVLPVTVSARSLNPPQAKANPAPLRVSGRNGQWTVNWDAHPGTGEATLAINGQKVALSPEQYAAGSYALPRLTGDVELALRTVRERAQAEEIRTRIVASATMRPPAPNTERRLSVEVDRLRQELEAERNRRRLLQQMVRENGGSR